MRQASRLGPRGTALAVAFFLLSPTFLLFPSAAASSSPAPATGIPGLPPPQATPSAFSTFKQSGAADPSMPVLVSVAIPLRNLPLLTSLVKESSNPRSPDFRHFITYAQASQTFLPTQAQYRSVVDWLTSRGFAIQSSSLNSMIVARGTAGMVDRYLGQNVQLFTNGTYSYYEATGQSDVPGAYSFVSNSTGLLMRPDYTLMKGAASGYVPSSNVTFTQGGQATTLLRGVYNSTGLLAKGDNGTGYTIGTLDFFGYSLVGQDLALYDSTYGIPAPPSFTITPIGPYNPNLGTTTGWDGEIDLDVQVSHAMAPGANVVLYAANGDLPLSAAIAAVVQNDKVNVLSQSFGLPEWEYYEAGPTAYLFNSVFADDYYMLGSAMGITFLASSGDGGGSGFSAGPLGAAQYPSTSPYVTALGGTSTYISTLANGSTSVQQTAWSNTGYAPYFANEGGGGGGVSILEPAPWWQSSLQVPPSFPDGRMVPDLSLDASGAPGTFVIYHGSPIPIGGTSEASPLFAGLLTLVMGANSGSLGLVSPTLYALAGNQSSYASAFDPVTFGYTIPWVAKQGYNLATGWGTPNIGEIAGLYNGTASSSSLGVEVGITNAGVLNFTDFTPGQTIAVTASITTPAGAPVTTGQFAATLQTLGGSTPPVSLALNSNCNASPPISDCWTGSIKVGDESGIANVVVSGSSGGSSGEGFATTFAGYLANFIQPVGPYPWTYLPGLQTAVSISDLFGNVPPFASTSVAFQGYSILSNAYSQEQQDVLNYSGSTGYYESTITANLSSGPTALVTQGPVVGYLPFVSGIGLLGTAIYPQMVAEPGSVAPGQSMTIVASVTAPENIYLTTSLATGSVLGAAIAEGANVTASLVSPSGSVVATAHLPEQTCNQALRACGATLTLINGGLTVPANATSGLYTVLLTAAYNDETTGFLYTGSYYGQIYVAQGASSPVVSVGPSTLFEGETATFDANITYPGGGEVTNGLYTAFVYPASAQGDYSSLMHSSYEAFALIPLEFNASLGLWTATAALPSPYNSSSASTNSNAEYYGGPYDVYVSGLSYDGVPTSSDLSSQQAFYIQPYVWTADTTISDVQQTSRLALSNVTIDAGASPVDLSYDYFVGNNTVTGSDVTISSSTISGSLVLSGGQTTLEGVSGGDVVANGGKVSLEHSSLSSLDLGSGATASIDSASSALRITPSLPSVTVTSPLPNDTYTGTFDANVSVTGGGVTELTILLDGQRLPSPAGSSLTGQPISIPINTSAMPDGTHVLTVTALQSDLLSSTTSVSFMTGNQLASVNSGLANATASLSSADQTIASLSQSLKTADGNVSSLQSTVNGMTALVYLAAAVAVVAVALSAYSLRGRPRQKS